MITMGKITHKRIAGSSKSSAMMEARRETFCFLCLLGNLASRKENWEPDTSFARIRTDGMALHQVLAQKASFEV